MENRQVPPFSNRGQVAGSPSNTVTWAVAYLYTKWHLNPSIHLATMDIGRKLGGCAPLVELGLHLTQCHVGQGLPPRQIPSRSIQPFRHNKHGPKIGGFTPFWEGAGSASNTKSPGLRPTSIPSGMLMHPVSWPQ